MATEIRESRGTVEVRQGPNGNPVIAGYGIVFNSDSENLGGFIEQVDPGAVTKTLAEADIRGVANHNTDWTLGRVKSGTMRLYTDSRGVRYEIDVNPDDPDGMRALAKVRRGDWDGSSFCFETLQEAWDWDATPARRRLLEIKLIEMGPVAFPAYPDSTAQASRAKAALSRIAAKLGHPVERMVEALKNGEIRSLVDQKIQDALADAGIPGETIFSGNVSTSSNSNLTVDLMAEARDVWSTAYVNDLPDRAFLYIEPGGDKDDEGKTRPRTLRHFPYKDANGKIDLPHLRNALARIPQSSLPQDVKDRATAKAKRLLAENGGEQDAAPAVGETRVGRKISAATAAALQRAVDELMNLLGEMEPPEPGEMDEEPDGDETNPYMMGLEPARALAAALTEFRGALPEAAEQTPIMRALALKQLRDREAAALELRLKLVA